VTDEIVEMRSSLQSWLRFIRAESYVLRERPDLLFQQVTNRRDNIAIANAAERFRHLASDGRIWVEWVNKPHASDPCVLTLPHKEAVLCCRFSPDGRQIASISADDNLKIWDAESGREIAGHSEPYLIYCEYSPDGDRLIFSLADESLRIVNAQSLSPIATIRAPDSVIEVDDEDPFVTPFAISPDGKRLAAGSVTGKLRLWDLNTLLLLYEIQAHQNSIGVCAFSPDGRHVVTGSDDGLPSRSEPPDTLSLWDSETGRGIATVAQITAIDGCFSPDGQHLAVAERSSKEFAIWNWGRGFAPCEVKQGESIGTEFLSLSGHKGDVNTCAYSPDGRWLASGGDDGVVQVWNAITGENVLTLAGHSSAVYSCAFSPDGQKVVSGSSDIKVWNVESLSFPAPDGSETQGIKIVDPPKHRESVSGCAYPPEGYKFVTVSIDGVVKVWDTSNGECLGTLQNGERLQFGSLTGLPCSYSPDGKLLALAAPSGITIWNAHSWEQIEHLQENDKGTRTCAWLPDSRQLVIASDDVLKLWLREKVGWRLQQTFVHGEEVNACCVSPCGELLVSGDKNGNLKIWNLEGGKELETLSGHRGSIMDCRFSPDGKRLISCSIDYRGELRIWEVGNWTDWKSLVGHTLWINSCAFLANGEFVVSGSIDGTLRLWNPTSREEVGRLNIGALTSLSVGEGGRRMVAGDKRGNVYLLALHGLGIDQ